MMMSRDSGFQAERAYMVKSQIEARGVTDRSVLDAMLRVPRHLFVPENLRKFSYEDSPIGIGYSQTISQPFIVAYMTALLKAKPHHRVLDIGTGSGYQAAVLAEIVREVYTIEIVPELLDQANAIFKQLDYSNIISKIGDGYHGWPEAAPFDGVIVAAAPERVPDPLLDQLAEGGRLVIPIGNAFQYLDVYTRERHEIRRERDIAVRFVPMTGLVQEE
jgi:protein-L-isoaspartate(D-aspartate) O-methyltransferase